MTRRWVLVNFLGERLSSSPEFDTLEAAETACRAEWAKGWEIHVAELKGSSTVREVGLRPGLPLETRGASNAHGQHGQEVGDRLEQVPRPADPPVVHHARHAAPEAPEAGRPMRITTSLRIVLSGIVGEPGLPQPIVLRVDQHGYVEYDPPRHLDYLLTLEAWDEYLHGSGVIGSGDEAPDGGTIRYLTDSWRIMYARMLNELGTTRRAEEVVR